MVQMENGYLNGDHGGNQIAVDLDALTCVRCGDGFGQNEQIVNSSVRFFGKIKIMILIVKML